MKSNIEKQFDRIAQEQKDELEGIENEYHRKERRLRIRFRIYLTIIALLAIAVLIYFLYEVHF